MGENKEPNISQGLSIRQAETMADINAIIELGRIAHQESIYREFSFEPEKLRQMGEQSIARPDKNGVLMAERDGKLIGFLVVLAEPHFFSKNLTATCLIFFVSPEHRGGLAAIKLLHACRKWAKNREIGHLYMHVTTGVGIQSTDKLLRRLGFEQTGGNYLLSLS